MNPPSRQWLKKFGLHRLPALLAAIGLLLSACASGHRAAFVGNLQSHRNLSIYEQRLRQAVSASRSLSLDEIGRVAYPDFEAPLWRILFRPNGPVKYSVLLSAGIHGNEPAGTEYALRFVKALALNPIAYKDVAIDIIPLVNPWGWVHDIRFNQAGIDINRDFATFASQEAAIIRDALKADQYTLMFDLHEDPNARGFYIYQYGLQDRRLAGQIVTAIEAMGYPVEQDVKMVVLKIRNGIIDAPMWGLHYMWLTGQLSIGNFYRLYHSPYVITVETPTSLPIEDRLRMQRTTVETLIAPYTK